MNFHSSLFTNRVATNLNMLHKSSMIKDYKTKFNSDYVRQYSNEENQEWRNELKEKINSRKKVKMLLLVFSLSILSYLTVLCIEQHSLFTSI